MKKLGYEIATGKSGKWKWRVLEGDAVIETGACDGSFYDAVDAAKEAKLRLEKSPVVEVTGRN
jgi:hypothetical protein